jgi:transcriptional regulator with XRE-family HTH domain
MMTAAKAEVRRGRASVREINRHIGAQIRKRRLMLGLSQPQLAELIGVTCQQVQNYEKGATRIAAGRLFALAHALGVEAGYFFAGVEDGNAFGSRPQDRMLFELACNYVSLPAEHQEAIGILTRSLIELELGAAGAGATELSADAAKPAPSRAA